MSQQSYNAAQLATIEREARVLLDDAYTGRIIRIACGALPAARRDRWHAVQSFAEIGRRYPLLADIVAEACRIAMRQRLDELAAEFGGDTDNLIRNADALLTALRDGDEP